MFRPDDMMKALSSDDMLGAMVAAVRGTEIYPHDENAAGEYEAFLNAIRGEDDFVFAGRPKLGTVACIRPMQVTAQVDIGVHSIPIRANDMDEPNRESVYRGFRSLAHAPSFEPCDSERSPYAILITPGARRSVASFMEDLYLATLRQRGIFHAQSPYPHDGPKLKLEADIAMIGQAPIGRNLSPFRCAFEFADTPHRNTAKRKPRYGFVSIHPLSVELLDIPINGENESGVYGSNIRLEVEFDVHGLWAGPRCCGERLSHCWYPTGHNASLGATSWKCRRCGLVAHANNCFVASDIKNLGL